VVKALVDHETVGQDKSLALVIRLNEVVDHEVASFDVFHCQAVFHAFALDQSEFSLQVRNLLFQTLDNDTSINSLVFLHIVLNQLDRTCKSAGAKRLVDVFFEGRDGSHHFGVAVAAQRVSQDHGHHAVTESDILVFFTSSLFI